jgi:hypothetical protein
MTNNDGGAAALRAKNFAEIRERLRELTERLVPKLGGPDVAGALMLSGVDTMIESQGRERCVQYLRDLATQVERLHPK